MEEIIFHCAGSDPQGEHFCRQRYAEMLSFSKQFLLITMPYWQKDSGS
jgi:hypothetical protein